MVPKSPPPSSLSIDHSSGFNYQTKTYHSLRPHIPVPYTSPSLSITDYILNLHHQSPTATAFLIDGATRHRIPYSQLQSYVTSLAYSLRHRLGLSKGHTAFIISPNSIHVPILYLSLLSIGVVVSPSNPASSVPEVARQIQLSNPVIAFATSDNVNKLPSLPHRPILLDSPEFDSLISTRTGEEVQHTVPKCSSASGYVNDEEASSSILTSDGWLRTGDLCYFDNEGFLFCVDRLKELIKCNGYQVPPAELEDLLQSHPDIVDAAVVPYPDDKAGQVPIAFAVRRPGSAIDESRIKDFVAKQVAPYKKLRHVSFIDAIPKNATGKVLRKELAKVALTNVMSRL